MFALLSAEALEEQDFRSGGSERAPKPAPGEQGNKNRANMTEQEASDKRKSYIKIKVCRLTLSWTRF